MDSTIFPGINLNKRHHALSFHRIREAIASGVLGFYWIDGSKNPADILSKHWAWHNVWPMLKPLLFWRGETADTEELKATDSDLRDKGE